MVFMSWKGIPDVRAHVVPTNPKTPLQIAQRNIMKGAVALYHTMTLTALDISGMTRWASLQTSVMSGFNWFCRAYVVAVRAAHTFSAVYGLALSDLADDGVKVAATGDAGNTYKIFYSSDLQALIAGGGTAANVTNADGALSVTLADLDASTRYFAYIGATGATTEDKSGLFDFTTLAS